MDGPVFKTATEAPSAAPVGSIPTRSRHLPRVTGLRRVAPLPLALALGAGLLSGGSLRAQDSGAGRRDTLARLDTAPAGPAGPARPADTAVRPDTAAPRDSLAPADSLPRVRVAPLAALWRSMVLPGWGQLKLRRTFPAGLFMAGEAFTVTMALRKNHELNALRRAGADTAALNAKSQQREDWLVLIAVNHVLAGLEAYVGASLADFPAELTLRRGPGGTAVGVTVPLRIP